jgi:hypothetical protein
MEKKFYTDDNFERLLREQTDRFTMQPTKRVWHSVYNNLHPARKWPSIAISLLLVASILLLGYLNKDNSSGTDKPVAAKDKQILPAASLNMAAAQPAENTTAGDNATATAQPDVANNSRQGIITNNTVNSSSISSGTIRRTASLTGRNTRMAGSNTITSTVNATTTAATGSNTGINTVAINGNENISVASTPASTVTVVPASASGEGSVNTNAVTGNSNAKSNTTAGAIINTTTAGAAEGATENSTAEKTDPEESTAAADKLFAKNDDNKTTDPAVQEKSAASLAKLTTAASMKAAAITTEDRMWMEDHAFYNRKNRGKWKNRLSWNVYATPSVSYRMLFDNTKSGENGSVVPGGPANLVLRDKSIESSVTHKPGPGIEVGAGLVYTLNKKWRIKTGVQANYNSYTVYANEIAHPFSTTIALNNLNTGNLDIESRFTSISNIPGGRQNRLNSYSYQLALPVGVDYKIRGNNTISWYAGASLQPSFVLASKSYLLSADRLAYTSTKDENNSSLMRRFNLAFGAETFVSYKKGDYTFMAGPKFRYQLLTTNSNAYTVGERVYNFGLSLGLLKNF